MANETNELVKQEATPQLPAYLQGKQAVGVENKGETEVTPRLKFVQKMSDDELTEEFGVGAILLGDEQVEVCQPNQSFTAVTVYQFPSWEVWKDVNDKSSDSPVEAMTTDPNSEIAQRAKARYSEDYGKKYTRTWIESMNFILHIVDGPASGSIAMLSYNKGSAKYGRRLKKYLQRTGAPIYAHRVKFTSEKTQNAKGDWFVAIGKSADPAFVDERDFVKYEELYNGFDTAYASGHVAHAAASEDDGN